MAVKHSLIINYLDANGKLMQKSVPNIAPYFFDYYAGPHAFAEKLVELTGGTLVNSETVIRFDNEYDWLNQLSTVLVDATVTFGSGANQKVWTKADVTGTNETDQAINVKIYKNDSRVKFEDGLYKLDFMVGAPLGCYACLDYGEKSEGSLVYTVWEGGLRCHFEINGNEIVPCRIRMNECAPLLTWSFIFTLVNNESEADV